MLERWRAWWRFANLEQAFSFLLVTVLTIALTSMLAYATLRGEEALPATVAFLELEGRRLQALAGDWFGWLFWGVGAFALFGSAMGIADYTSRLAADVLKTTYLREASVSERLSFVARSADSQLPSTPAKFRIRRHCSGRLPSLMRLRISRSVIFWTIALARARWSSTSWSSRH